MEKPTFVPMLIIKSGTHHVDFYKNVFGAVELKRWSNDDGSIHVAELSINGTLFHLREEGKGNLSPENAGCITTITGLMVNHVDAIINRAIEHGATDIDPAKDYEYGYRQGSFKDPFGHKWLIEKII